MMWRRWLKWWCYIDIMMRYVEDLVHCCYEIMLRCCCCCCCRHELCCCCCCSCCCSCCWIYVVLLLFMTCCVVDAMNMVYINKMLWYIFDVVVLLMMHLLMNMHLLLMMLHDDVHACIFGRWSRTSVQWWDSGPFDDETPAQEGYDPMMRGSRFYDGNLGVVNL